MSLALFGRVRILPKVLVAESPAQHLRRATLPMWRESLDRLSVVLGKILADGPSEP
ncbi:MAG TPA: hypothetical protein VMT51_10630 [Dongiaceae bacterium]|nr:hypothetical protein [Dongiaceae bacterium]